MNINLSDEAAEFGRVARQALETAGGDELVQRAERDPEHRGDLVSSVLGELGAWDLDPRAGADDLEAAAALCRSAGYWAISYPVAERLARPTDLASDGLLVVADTDPAAAVAFVDLRWTAVTLDGRRGPASLRPLAVPPRKSVFVTELDVDWTADHDVDDDGAADVALGLVLPCWTLLGMLDRAIDLTRAYVREREQFGQPIASFQAVQFQLTDAEVERIGVEELAKYALWSSSARPDDAVADALALRVAAVEAAEIVFRIAHQLHGAIGFCDETTLSWVSRASVPLRRLPFGVAGSREQLTRHVGRRGLSGLFDDLVGG